MTAADAIAMVLAAALAILMVVWWRRAILGDRAEREAWWRGYRDRERLSYLQVGWCLGLRRSDGEDEAAYAARAREALLGVVREVP